MLTSYKGRNIQIGVKSKIYFNLHLHVFSIKQQLVENGKKKWLVVGHGDNLKLSNPYFQVKEKDRLRVLEENRKNVHAFVIGSFEGIDQEMETDDMDQIYYNPRTVSQFMTGQEESNNMGYDTVLLKGRRIFGNIY